MARPRPAPVLGAPSPVGPSGRTVRGPTGKLGREPRPVIAHRNDCAVALTRYLHVDTPARRRTALASGLDEFRAARSMASSSRTCADRSPNRYGMPSKRDRATVWAAPGQRAEPPRSGRVWAGRAGAPDEQVHRQPVRAGRLPPGEESSARASSLRASVCMRAQTRLARTIEMRCAKVVAGIVEEGTFVLERSFDAGDELVEMACELGELLARLGDRQLSALAPLRHGGDLVGLPRRDRAPAWAQHRRGTSPHRHDGGQQREADQERLLETVLGVNRLVERRPDRRRARARAGRPGPASRQRLLCCRARRPARS